MARTLAIEIVGDARSLNRALNSTQSTTRGFGKNIANLGKVAAGAAGAAGIGALIFTVKTGISEFAQAQKVTAQTNAVIKSTGNVARVTTEGIKGLAQSLMRKSGVDDEAIQSGENMLLTFTKIRNEAGKGNRIFDQATRATLDLSVAMGKDMQSSAILVGKALNDPIKGVTALTKAGIQLTDSQKATIKSLVESGQTMEAQKLILEELNTQFGGSAEAAGKTLPGQIAILRESFNNWAGDMTARLIPVLQQVVAWLKENWPEISKVITKAWEQDIKPVIAAFSDVIVALVRTIREHWGTIGPIVEGVADVIKTQLAIVTNALEFVAALLRGDWSKAWREFKETIDAVWDAIKARIELAKTVLSTLMKGVGTALKDALVAGLKGIGNAAWGVINNIGEKVGEMGKDIAEWGAGIGRSIKGSVINAITGIGGAVWAVINNIGSTIDAKAKDIVGWGTTIGTKVKDAAVAALKGIGSAIVTAVKAAINEVIDAFNALAIPGFKINMPKPIPDVNFPGVALPDLPRLHSGGMFRAPTPGGEGLALLKDREMVLPARATGGGTIVVPLMVDGTELARVLIDPMRRLATVHERRNGKAAF